MNARIVCRAFQGIGGCGIYSLTIIILFEMVPPAKWPRYLILSTSLFACAMALGPIFGGLINIHSTWIWVFLLK
jgi:MFS family permease